MLRCIPRSTFVLSISLLFVARSAAQQCYFPDHSIAKNFTVCNAAVPYSACCRAVDVCLSNGYCLQQGDIANRIIRGACSDQTFSSTACPKRCTDTASNLPVSIYLAYDEAPQGNFCCVTNYNVTSGRCTTPSGGSSEPFQLTNGTVIYDRSNGALLPQEWTSTDSGGAVTTVTVAAKSSNGDNNVTAIAAGIAVPLGVLLIAALAGCGVLWSQLQKAKRGNMSAGAGVVAPTETKDGGYYYGAVSGHPSESPYDYPVQSHHGAPLHQAELPVHDHVFEAPAESK